jgi:predicted ATP-grasp superfamily ATP-dependent carboligase
MRILVYEHITGGGMLDDPRIAVLAPEGDLMLRALVEDLSAIPGVEVFILRDFRLKDDVPAESRIVCPGELSGVFGQAAEACDAVWPIAPETDGILFRLTQEILARGRRVLGSRLDAIRIAASKKATAAVLARAGIAVAHTYSSESDLPPEVGEVVTKMDDGAGCQDTLLFSNRNELRIWAQARAHAKSIFQPYIRGGARSLSILCCDGRGRLLACNRQNVQVHKGAFHFNGVGVNAMPDEDGRYSALASDVCRALPGLWGYCGVDFIAADAGPTVIEVNPRLTTSYAGLRKAIGINPAQLVLDLPGSLDVVVPVAQAQRIVDVEIAHGG